MVFGMSLNREVVILNLVVLFIGSLGGLADKKNRLDLEALLGGYIQ